MSVCCATLLSSDTKRHCRTLLSAREIILKASLESEYKIYQPTRELNPAPSAHHSSRRALCLSHLSHKGWRHISVNGIVCMFPQIYLEYCVGGSVDGIMHELERPLSELQISCICHQICEALEFIHGRNVIHRDLKAGNILLNAEGLAKLGTLNSYVKFIIFTRTCNKSGKSQVH